MNQSQSSPGSNLYCLHGLPEKMVGHPFGFDENGKPVGRTKGSIVRVTVEYMLECVAKQARASISSRVDIDDHLVEETVAQAKESALKTLNRLPQLCHP